MQNHKIGPGDRHVSAGAPGFLRSAAADSGHISRAGVCPGMVYMIPQNTTICSGAAWAGMLRVDAV